MKKISILFFCFLQLQSYAQELFTFTEPASNMPSRSMAIRINNRYFYHPSGSHQQYQLAPEFMLGISKKMMVYAETFFSTTSNRFNCNGLSLYAKYRAYSADNVHSHFRLGLYGRYTRVNVPIQQQAIDLNGFNSGWESGTVVTILNKRTALSANVSVLHALDNGQDKIFSTDNNSRNAMNTSLSVGRLMLPKEYKNFNQTNLNLMLETLAQVNVGNGRSYIDVAPVLQFILRSRVRVDFSYRMPVLQSLNRPMYNSFLLRMDYNFFNVW